ncbi:MAG: peptide-methionine (S)-S-oxide reductase MsrA [Verrucomicrobiota bacterium]
MKTLSKSLTHLSVILITLLSASACLSSGPAANLATSPDATEFPEGTEVATFGAGCFWCVEEVFHQTPGVLSAVSGYMGGTAETADYQLVARGRTDHVEVVQVHFDPNTLSFDQLLDVFFKQHDPTTLDRQGPDVGPQYRSIVFYHDDLQKLATEAKIKALTEEAVYGKRTIVTEVSEAMPFYEAEDYHQNFARLNPRHGYLIIHLYPKLRKLGLKVPSSSGASPKETSAPKGSTPKS